MKKALLNLVTMANLILALTPRANAAALDKNSPDLRQGNAAAPVVVEMKSLSFEPKSVQLLPGQKVIWKNVSYTEHSATSESNEFDTGMIAPKTTSKPIVFTKAGSYPYHCSMHGKSMSGLVIVKGQ